MTRTYLLVALALVASTICRAQFQLDIKAGLSSRIMPTAYADAGFRFYKTAVLATAGGEAGMGFNTGLLVQQQFYAIHLYGGMGYFSAINTKLAEGSRPYVIAGVQFKDPWGRGLVDIRYMGDAIHIGFGVTIGKQND